MTLCRECRAASVPPSSSEAASARAVCVHSAAHRGRNCALPEAAASAARQSRRRVRAAPARQPRLEAVAEQATAWAEEALLAAVPGSASVVSAEAAGTAAGRGIPVGRSSCGSRGGRTARRARLRRSGRRSRAGCFPRRARRVRLRASRDASASRSSHPESESSRSCHSRARSRRTRRRPQQARPQARQAARRCRCRGAARRRRGRRRGRSAAAPALRPARPTR